MGNPVAVKGDERRSAMVLDLNIKQKGLMGENSVVTDEYGVVRYVVRGNVGIMSSTFRIFAGEDDSAPEVAVVQRRQSGLAPKLTITIDGREATSIVAKTTFFTKRYLMEGVGLEAKGDWLNSDLTVTRDGETVARARQRFLSAYDREVSVLDESVATIVVALLVAIGAVDNDETAIMAAAAL
ncbi:hypothetical protein JS528_01775 [Bifidobacterium sp. MA2]|uniref:Uncharacterized protein n=1 Tax=Bifidobacterium santillanense TaxID=2809028 RepID=A0ABS5UMF7_9BIFI|nr:hypothetical protein [Bifidobacterium santillanense]MBT1172107.1 hypothetical protein [Bifidobacterium santillanense]